MMTLPAKACPPIWLIILALGVLISIREYSERAAAWLMLETNDGRRAPRNL